MPESNERSDLVPTEQTCGVGRKLETGVVLYFYLSQLQTAGPSCLLITIKRCIQYDGKHLIQ